MNILETIDRLFAEHAPETLMAFFGAVTSMFLFSLVWMVLRYFFKLLTHDFHREADQEQATGSLMESLVEALVSEAGHLRHTLDDILGESVRCGEQNTQVLAVLLARTESIPTDIFQLLKPELEHLYHEMQLAESRILSKVAEVSGQSASGEETRTEEDAVLDL